MFKTLKKFTLKLPIQKENASWCRPMHVIYSYMVFSALDSTFPLAYLSGDLLLLAVVSFTCMSTRSLSVKCLLEHFIDSLAFGAPNVPSHGVYLAEWAVRSSCVIKNKWRKMIGEHALDREINENALSGYCLLKSELNNSYTHLKGKFKSFYHDCQRFHLSKLWLFLNVNERYFQSGAHR